MQKKKKPMFTGIFLRPFSWARNQVQIFCDFDDNYGYGYGLGYTTSLVEHFQKLGLHALGIFGPWRKALYNQFLSVTGTSPYSV